MKLAIQLTDQQASRLEQEAKRLGVATEELARAAVVELVNQPADDFRVAAARVLRKNAELYERLS